MQPEPPLPVSATYNLTTDTFQVVFDRQLRNDPAVDAANWVMTKPPGPWREGLNVQVRGFSVFGTTQPRLGGPPVGEIEYTPPPFDVLGRVGGVAPAFAGFPLVFHT